MGSIVEENMKSGTLVNGVQTNLIDEMKLLKEIQNQSGGRKAMNSELWYACAGPLVSLPHVGSLVYYFPQGHSEQVAVSTKRLSTTQIPNYPNLPSQLLCQVHNVTLHADKETDEIYAQMSLQPVNSEKDVFPIPDFGFKSCKHPTEFFCKTLTASDTSTHGGFSVPRRAAEKLFPPLDYSMQPPTQELVVRDLHDNTWTFRHIYRGQPKRHLLTTGWSLFVGSKRLKAGDSVLFIRDSKSQLLVGVRRANRQQTTLPSSVLSADSMHIGVLAAAAHAAANRSSFTIFYNPRACPSEFVISLAKYRKAVYGTQVSVGMRFGMMFETEESGKRRYMGTILGISDMDPLRWPGSKWRSLQVEWDEPGCSDKQNRVSPWEIETPESLFIFPSLTSGLKRNLHSGYLGDAEWRNLIKAPRIWFPENGHGDLPYSSMAHLYPEPLVRTLMKAEVVNQSGTCLSTVQEASTPNGTLLDLKNIPGTFHAPLLNQPQFPLVENLQYPKFSVDQQGEVASSLSKANDLGKSQMMSGVENPAPVESAAEKLKAEPDNSTDQASHLTSSGECNEEKLSMSLKNMPNSGNQPLVQHDNLSHVPLHASSPWPSLDSSIINSQQISLSQFDSNFMNVSPPLLETEWSSCATFAGLSRPSGSLPLFGLQDSSILMNEGINPSFPMMNQDMWGQQKSNLRYSPQAGNLNPLTQQDLWSLNSNGAKNLSDESNNQSGIYDSLKFNTCDGAGSVINASVSNAILDEFCSLKENDFQNPSDCLMGNFSTSQDVQSQITSASFVDSQTFSRQDFPDSCGGTSSSNVEFDNGNLLQSSSWQQVAPRVRTYTKVQKAGSVGRSIDVSSFKNYEELCSAIECMFGLEGLLNEPRGCGWKLVYVDYENDVLLIGDDPWEEFVGCVRCIRILSPSEVEKMSEEGMKLLNSANIQGMSTGASIPEGSQ